MAASLEYNQYHGTKEEENRSLIMEVYYPFIIETVRSTDILVHLVQLQDHFSELRMLDKEGKHAQSMMMLLRYLDASDQPRKWRPFIDALNSAGYQDLYRGLEFGEDIPTSENEKKYQLILRFLPKLIERVRLENSGILPFLVQHRIISEHQLESIRACIRYHSNQDAILELILHLHTKTQKWYTVFLEALLQDGHKVLVEDIDPEFMLAKKRKRKMTFNFDSLDYEDGEDRLSVDGEAEECVLLTSTPTNNPQDEEDRTRGESSGSIKSMPDSLPTQTNIRDYEILFPLFPECPRIDLNEEDMMMQLMECLTLSEESTCPVHNQDNLALKGIEKATTSLECWKTHKFKPWCVTMEEYIKLNNNLIRNREDLFFLVDKWLLYLQNCVEHECGEVEIYKTQIENFSQLMHLENLSEFGDSFNELFTELEDVKNTIHGKDNVMLQHVHFMVQQIKNGQIDNIENFQNLDLTNDINVVGINCGKVVKYIGLLWKDLK